MSGHKYNLPLPEDHTLISSDVNYVQKDDQPYPPDRTIPRPKELSPVDVRIISDVSERRELENVKTATFTVPNNGQSQSLCSRVPGTKKLVVANLESSTNIVYIGPSPQVMELTGYGLIGGQQVEINTERELFVYVPTSAAQPVRISYIRVHVTGVK